MRLGAPFPIRCTSFGEYISKSRKFNACEETTDKRCLNIPPILHPLHLLLHRDYLHIDPKNMDYKIVREGAEHNFELWRDESKMGQVNETDEERLYRENAQLKKHGTTDKQCDSGPGA